MEREARRGVAGGLMRVEDVAENRPAAFAEVDAELVRASGDRFEFDQRMVVERAQDAEAGEAGLAEGVIDDLSRTPGDIRSNGQVDFADERVGNARDDRDVSLSSRAMFELRGEQAVGLRIKGEDHEARGIHVEAMDDERAGGLGKHGLHARRHAVLVRLALSGDGEHARRLVDHDEARLGEDDGRIRKRHREVLAAGERVARAKCDRHWGGAIALCVKNSLIVALVTSGASIHAAAHAQTHAPVDGTRAWVGQSEEERKAELGLLGEYAQLTHRDMFVKAGEAYFDHQSPPRWVVFQAVPVAKEGEEPESFYSMYVAKLKYEGERIVGIEEPRRISAPGSANTCGWFHPQKPFSVLFGSTLGAPASREKPGFRVGTRNYVWQFPDEMDIVERSVSSIEQDVKTAGELGEQLRGLRALLTEKMPPIKKLVDDNRLDKMHAQLDALWADADKRYPQARAIKNWTEARVVFAKPKYGAECSYSKDGRFILYAQVREELTRGKDDADIWVYDTQSGHHHALVTADGYDGGPFFSPDGSRICYRSDRQGDDKLQLFVADLRFENGVPVGVERETQITANEHVNWAPYWHPSGEFLVYGTSEISHGNYEVFAIEAPARGSAGHGLKRGRVTTCPGADVLPVFNEDGAWMMWTAQRGSMIAGESKPSSQVWVARVREASDWVKVIAEKKD